MADLDLLDQSISRHPRTRPHDRLLLPCKECSGSGSVVHVTAVVPHQPATLYRRRSDHTSSATSSLNAAGDNSADRVHHTQDTPVSHRSAGNHAVGLLERFHGELSSSNSSSVWSPLRRLFSATTTRSQPSRRKARAVRLPASWNGSFMVEGLDLAASQIESLFTTLEHDRRHCSCAADLAAYLAGLTDIINPVRPEKWSSSRAGSFSAVHGQEIRDLIQFDAYTTSSFAPIQYAYNAMGGSAGVYTADYTEIGYRQNLDNGMTGHGTGLTASYAGQTVPTMAAKLSDGSDCITSESEIALSPKTESQIGHVDVGKDDDNVLRDSGEIESKVAMHTYQRPYPEHVDSVPYPQGFEVPNFMKFTGENAMTTMEHIGHFIDQCNASLMEQRPIDTSSVTCETISVTSMPKTGIVSDPFPVSSIDVDKKKGKRVIIGDPRPKNRINNAKAEDHKVVKDELSSIQRTKKPKLTFEMLMAKYKKGLAGQ
uniref:Retrotransposon protein, putative, Ty3-gypsy subclass n=1 Tax=Oryza sativa subsp. japonica TaxID=39947 RepID=Q2QTP8_ORYSJ|nr:retrotransposon protein, putative, Ty3-gypsy subclass [Oryza sativa Japonica Group]